MSSIATPTATQVVQSPPIAQLVVLASKTSTILVAGVSYLIHAFVILTSWISYPMLIIVTAPLPFILYVLSPILVFGQIVLGGLFILPYNAIVDLFVALQPFYVFCGVACISGAIVGIGGRLIAGVVSSVIIEQGRVDNTASMQPLSEGKLKKRIVS